MGGDHVPSQLDVLVERFAFHKPKSKIPRKSGRISIPREEITKETYRCRENEHIYLGPEGVEIVVTKCPPTRFIHRRGI